MTSPSGGQPSDVAAARAARVVRIGLLGAGRIGRIHGANVAAHPRARLAATADANPQAAESLAAATGSHVRDPDSIIDDPDITRS